ncbi:unnamed protein product [Arabidopsis lyrata]|uniref:Uncharacterized protein n=1 Tax=Arabidopsis lyrata subsp. lyrata TaxID=81972 RepID=D7LA32_ARALL|nr:uncharacterized protein LOC9319271 [Arabidopsis lyrata subsp. lyrata]XP_020886424.1 uncharacterized protein LOC9319271 [Arabidopsis lyrata subsp. lyrata]EFH61587.1 hypothetical protein ARALYDRAFT_898366 [Arabidopsis lyrata subsp. lyrata]CAH8261094.1 unnamed protein product [Arabidopsis lyrata]|eukprot:XP_002885328.1 uncharacterized protein LOC9319271 [Arabidopsis lyrata subsp. lyrata]
MDNSKVEVDNDHASGSKGSSVGENSLDSEEYDDMSDDSTEEESDENSASYGKILMDYLMSEMIADMYDDFTDDLFDILAARIPSLSALRTCNKQPSDDKTSTVFYSMNVLNNLTGVRMWSPLYVASLTHIQAHVTHREAFLAFSDPENKICYLEHKTSKKRDE